MIRAGIVITGTEVLTGIITDRNGPWLSERLRGLGVDVAHVMVVGDRREDVRAALDFLAAQDMALVVTSGGLGPTADDLTTEVVAGFAGRELALDEALEGRIFEILMRLRAGARSVDEAALRAGNRKQALVPVGATVLEPQGTAPGLVVPTDGPVVVVLPGPPRELQPMWEDALATAPVRAVLARAGRYEQRVARLYGIPESELARSLATMEAEGVSLEGLEVTTCLRRGELEVATVFAPDAEPAYDRFLTALLERHGEVVFAPEGETVDELVARLLSDGGRWIATGESCTGGLLAARLTERAGSSAYVAGGAVTYADAAKTALLGVDPALIAAHGAVSPQVAAAMAIGARERFGADVGVGITGIAGPGGGTPEKPVGTVCVDVSSADGGHIARTALLPGDRALIRERTTTLALHLVRRLLQGHTSLPGR